MYVGCDYSFVLFDVLLLLLVMDVIVLVVYVDMILFVVCLGVMIMGELFELVKCIECVGVCMMVVVFNGFWLGLCFVQYGNYGVYVYDSVDLYIVLDCV